MTAVLAPGRALAARARDRRFAVAVAAIAAAGLVWRMVHTALTKRDAAAGSDGLYYFLQARALREGHGFIDPVRFYGTQGEVVTPTAGHPPLYALYLAGWRLLGVDTPFGSRLVSCLLGAATIVVVALLVRRLAGARAGIIGAVLAAAYPLLWINDAMLLSESMAALTTALALLAAVVFHQRPTMANAGWFGAAVALATLSRAEAALLFPIVVVPMVLRSRDVDWAGRARRLVVAALAASVLLGPWVVRNLVVFERPVLLSNGYGATLRGASCDAAWYGDVAGLYSYCPSDPGDGDESQRDAVVREQAFDYIGDHLDRLPALVAIRVARLWDLYEPGQNLAYWAGVEDRGWAASRAGLAAYYLLLPLAIAGAVVLWRRKQAVLPFLAVAITATFTAAITYANIRYRIAVEVAIVALAAVAIDVVVASMRPPREAAR